MPHESEFVSFLAGGMCHESCPANSDEILWTLSEAQFRAIVDAWKKYQTHRMLWKTVPSELILRKRFGVVATWK